MATLDIGVTIVMQQYLRKEVKEVIMKKRILLICMILTLVILSSCGVQNNAESTDGESETKSSNYLYEIDKESADAAIEVEGLDIERTPLYVDSVDELIKIINDVKQGKEIDTNNVSALDALIVPNFTIDGYYLMKIEVTKVSIFYYYTPLTVSRADGFVDYDRDYVVTVRRSEYVNKSNPLQPLIDQLNLTPDEDGFLYDSKHREMTFAYENVWVSIRVPDGVNNYQKIKSLCSVKTLKID